MVISWDSSTFSPPSRDPTCDEGTDCRPTSGDWELFVRESGCPSNDSHAWLPVDQ